MITLFFLLMLANGDIDAIEYKKTKFTKMEECQAAASFIVPEMFNILNKEGITVPAIQSLCVRNTTNSQES